MSEELNKTMQQNCSLDKLISNDMLKVEMHQTDGAIRSHFANGQHAYLTNSIRFADAKAGALVTVNGLVLKFVTDMLETSTGYSDILFKVSLLILIASILFSLAVVFPRLLASNEKGIIYWEHINNYGKEQYIKTICEDETKDLLKSSVENNYIQASILTKKFKQLVVGFKISIASYSVIAIALLLKFFM